VRLLSLLVAMSIAAGSGAAGSAVLSNVSWGDFLSRHDPIWMLGPGKPNVRHWHLLPSLPIVTERPRHTPPSWVVRLHYS